MSRTLSSYESRIHRLPDILNEMPYKYLKYLPRFKGDGSITIEEHLKEFQEYIDHLHVLYDKVFLRMFV